MRIAFAAPMKPPDDPVPSGDRTFARAILAALSGLGHDVELASRFRSWTREPDRQPALRSEGLREAAAVLARLRENPPDFFLTYHLYHRAPDWIGPAVSQALAIPYGIIEASFARKQMAGPWAQGAADARAALEGASLVAAIQSEDEAGLKAVVPEARLTRLAPFSDLSPFLEAPLHRPEGRTLKLLSVGMMRPGNKAETYRALASALSAWEFCDWHLCVVGEGPERGAIEPLFAPEKTRFLGGVPAERLQALYREADIFVWPSVKEPFGFVFMEAMASGLPAIGGRSGGVPDVVRDGKTGLLVEASDPATILAALDTLRDPAVRARMGEEARRIAVAEHSLKAGQAKLAAFLERTCRNFADRPLP
ncbi:glycosyltransferase family 4 protein [Afifella sp. IM 167]|uniref:glycosyltransferase family 4 protein n=1 Tax=Afifella sp. IM 167 TaxID=2033586 RepID=UPI001CCDB5D8|nr:glycosyltransferase family 4 protein [Afifella sp. IM 167]MBZ8133166.1 glycosyl transferase [Afifella sp. IM 167]